MRKFFLLTLFAVTTLPKLFSDPIPNLPESAHPFRKDEPLQIHIVYPKEGAKISPVKSSFVFGSVSSSSANVWVNGATVPVYPTGSYLAMIPFSPGEFKIKAEAELNGQTTEFFRTVYVSSPATSLPDHPLTISTDSIQPELEMVVMEGDEIPLRFRGSPNCKAEYRFKKLRSRRQNGWKEMVEKNFPVPGIYEGSAIIQQGDFTENTFIEYRLTNPSGQKVKALSPGRIKIIEKNSFSLMEVNVEEAVSRTAPSIGTEMMGYDLFLPQGVKVRSTGKIGKEVRIKFSDFESGWTDEKNLKVVPNGTSVPRAILNRVKTEEKERSVILTFDLKGKVPYRANISNDLRVFNLTFFHTVSNIDRIHYDEPNGTKRLGQVRWFQIANETAKVECQLKEKIWGYDLRYEGNKLLCEIIFPPRVKNGRLPLSGLKVFVDPGHSLELGDGAMSPLGIKEAEINFKIAACLKEKLEKSGAKVLLTRSQNESVALTERGRKAWKFRADLFISVHTNALPDGANPLERHGFSVFYFQPQSFELARSVHSSYKKMVRIPDDGLYYGNLAVCRITQMPAILTESAYLIYPEEEALLLTKEFQCLVSEAIVDGILNHFQTE